MAALYSTAGKLVHFILWHSKFHLLTRQSSNLTP